MKAILNASDIMKILPHRYPFILLDCVTELVPGKMASGIKNITINEPYFQGHFIGEPLVPGTMIIESLAQLTAVMYCSGLVDGTTAEEILGSSVDLSSHVGYLVGVEKFRFKQPVRPGDNIDLSVILKETFGKVSNVKVIAKVDGKIVAQGIITVSQK